MPRKKPVSRVPLNGVTISRTRLLGHFFGGRPPSFPPPPGPLAGNGVISRLRPDPPPPSESAGIQRTSFLTKCIGLVETRTTSVPAPNHQVMQALIAESL